MMHLDELAVRVQRARVHAAKGEAVLVLVACELVREARHDLVDLNHLLLATFAAAIATAEARRSEGRLGRTAREPFVSRLARRPKLEVPLAQGRIELPIGAFLLDLTALRRPLLDRGSAPSSLGGWRAGRRGTPSGGGRSCVSSLGGRRGGTPSGGRRRGTAARSGGDGCLFLTRRRCLMSGLGSGLSGGGRCRFAAAETICDGHLWRPSHRLHPHVKVLGVRGRAHCVRKVHLKLDRRARNGGVERAATHLAVARIGA